MLYQGAFSISRPTAASPVGSFKDLSQPLPGPSRILPPPNLDSHSCYQHCTLWPACLPGPASCFHFSFCRTPSAWPFFSSDIIRNVLSCNCLMVGISPVSWGAHIKPSPNLMPWVWRIGQGQLYSGAGLALQRTLPGALLEEKGKDGPRHNPIPGAPGPLNCSARH